MFPWLCDANCVCSEKERTFSPQKHFEFSITMNMPNFAYRYLCRLKKECIGVNTGRCSIPQNQTFFESRAESAKIHHQTRITKKLDVFSKQKIMVLEGKIYGSFINAMFDRPRKHNLRWHETIIRAQIPGKRCEIPNRAIQNVSCNYEAVRWETHKCVIL